MTNQIALGHWQLEELNALATKEKRPVEQLVRQAVEDFLARRRHESEDAFNAGLGLWGDGEDGLAYQERLRSEW